MNIEFIRNHCLSKAGVEEDFPFDDNTLVFKVGGKMFALVGLNKAEFVNLKCDPERAIMLREKYPDTVSGAYHMNKVHWNSVRFDGGLSPDMFRQLIDHSYDLVFASLTKKVRESIS